MLVLSGCGQRTLLTPVDDARSQYAYFPLAIGKYRVYQVDSIVYDFGPGGSTVRDTARCWVRLEVTDTLRDNTGQLLFSIERQEKKTENAPWTTMSVGAAARNDQQAILIENNLRFLSLVFPMDQRSAWNGLLWIDPNMDIEIAGERIRPFRNWAYEVDSIDIVAHIGTFSFDSTLLITEANDINLIERRYSRARYAKNIGLVWREQWILDSQYCNRIPPPPDCESLSWEFKAEKGYMLQQTIIEFN